METLAEPTLKSIDEAIAARLVTRAEVERKRLEAEAEQKQLEEEGKLPFYDALAARIAADYRVDIRQDSTLIEHNHTNSDGPAYQFRLLVDAEPAAPGVEVEAWISLKWSLTANGMRDENRRNMVWITRRRALFDGADDGPVTLFYEFGDFVDALVMAKTGKYK